MISGLKCHKHPHKQAAYICTLPQCVENLLCSACVTFHDGQHNSRLLILNETFTNEDSLLNLTKKKQIDLIDQLTNIIKAKEYAIDKTVQDINSCFEVILEETVNIIQEFKREIISEFKSSINKETGYENERLEHMTKTLSCVKLEDEEDINNTVKKIQSLEDDLLPSAYKLHKEIKPNGLDENIQKYQLLLSNLPQEFSKKLHILLSELHSLKPYSGQQFNELIKSSFNLSITLPVNDLIISNTLRLESDILHKYEKIIIENGGVLTVDPWNGYKGGRLLIICNTLILRSKGLIDVSGCGYRGGLTCNNTSPNQSYAGECYNTKGSASKEPNIGGGGGGPQDGSFGGVGGGGGGYGTTGWNSEPNTESNGNTEGGKGGLAYGDDEMTVIYMGSGGGGGAPYCNGDNKGKGGNGGGVIIIIAKEFYNEGKILSNGASGEDALTDSYGSGGGGGSGGSIYITALVLNSS